MTISKATFHDLFFAFGATFPEEIWVSGPKSRWNSLGLQVKTRHLQNRTSVKIYFNTGTVLQVVVFLYSDRKNGLRDDPKSGISSGNVVRDSLFRDPRPVPIPDPL